MMVVRSQSGVPGAAGVPGGQIGMVQLGRALARIGVDVEVFVGGSRMAYLAGLEGVATSHFGWPAWLDMLLRACPAPVRTRVAKLRRRRWLDAVLAHQRAVAADVVHVQGLEDAEWLLDRFAGQLVVTHWGRVGRWRPTRGAGRDAVLETRLRRIRENATVVAIGEVQGEELASAGIPPAEVIPPGIDLRRFTPGNRAEARRHTGLPADDGVVLYVGRLAVDKNVETLLRAFAMPPRHARPTRLLIIGDGPLRDRLKRLSDEFGIGASTTFLPLVPHGDLPAYYRSCDVTVVPSDRLETFCMVALEAIACRAPLIVSGEVPEIVRRFPSVPVVAAHDAEQLRRAIDAALDGSMQPAYSGKIVEYDWSAIARRYVPVYRSVLRSRVENGYTHETYAT
jgi:glycosyltransferase involved in cell wall biosynthesis